MHHPTTGRRKLVFNVAATAVISLVIVLLVGELVCRLFFPDTQLRYVWDPEALFRFAPNQIGVMPLADGLRSPPARINRLGFRGPDPVARGEQAILVLGDSLTFGSGVSDEETFAARLDRAFGGRVAVINGGQPGYGVFQMAAALRRVGHELRPNLVIVVLWQGDLLRQPPDNRGRTRLRWKARISRVLKTSVFLTRIARSLERVVLRFGKETGRVGEWEDRTRVDSEVAIEAHLRGFRADVPRLLEMDRQARRYGQGLFVVLWPKEGYAEDAEAGLADRLMEALIAFGRKHGIPVTSLQSAMRRMPPTSLLIPNDGHPTPLAHCLAAEHLAQELTRLGWRTSSSLTCR